MRMTLTKAAIERIDPPASGYVLAWDDQSRGLGVRVTAGGVRSYVFQARHRGRPRRLTLGRCDEMTASQARRVAGDMLRNMGAGSDPMSEVRAQQLEDLTLRMALDEYLEGRDLAESTRRHVEGNITYHLADWLDRRVQELTRYDVERRHREIGRDSPSAANATMRNLRTILNRVRAAYVDASGAPLLQDNVVGRLSATRGWFREKKREGYLRGHQIRSWLEGCETLPATPRDYFLVVLLTGLRRNEALYLQCADVDLTDRSLYVPHTKTGRPHSLPLSDQLVEILGRRVEEARGRYVFGAPRGRGPLDPREYKKQITRHSGIEFRIHDLRRTFATVAESLDLPAYTIKRLLNHHPGDITAGYLQIHMDRLREPMQRISDEILT